MSLTRILLLPCLLLFHGLSTAAAEGLTGESFATSHISMQDKNLLIGALAGNALQSSVQFPNQRYWNAWIA